MLEKRDSGTKDPSEEYAKVFGSREEAIEWFKPTIENSHSPSCKRKDLFSFVRAQAPSLSQLANSAIFRGVLGPGSLSMLQQDQSSEERWREEDHYDCSGCGSHFDIGLIELIYEVRFRSGNVLTTPEMYTEMVREATRTPEFKKLQKELGW